MKTAFLRTICVVVSLCLVSLVGWAQNKTQAYYNSHEREILPDARTAFKNGDYDQTVELCRWHYIIVGDRQADSLRDQAQRCGDFSRRMTELKNQGNLAGAKAAAQSLLDLNPDDAAAKQLLKEVEELENAVQPEPVPEPETPVQPVRVDTVVVDKPVEPVVVEEPEPEVKPVVEEPVPPVVPVTPSVKKEKPKAAANLFVIKAGATVVDMNHFAIAPIAIAPGAGLGLYNLGGSPIGLEAGFSYGFGLDEKTASMFGLDAAVAIRASNSVYPKAGLGFFSCKSSVTDSSTNGLCAVASLTFLVGGHFAMEVGVKYYPKVYLGGTEPVSTAGTVYTFPTSGLVVPGGIAPMASFGWAF